MYMDTLLGGNPKGGCCSSTLSSYIVANGTFRDELYGAVHTLYPAPHMCKRG